MVWIGKINFYHKVRHYASRAIIALRPGQGQGQQQGQGQGQTQAQGQEQTQTQNLAGRMIKYGGKRY